MKIDIVKVGSLETNCYLVSSENKNAIVIDPGCDTEKIAAAINANGLNVKYIVLTHGHFDHIGAANDIKELTGAPIAVTAEDAQMITENINSNKRRTPAAKARYDVLADIIIKEGDVITLDELSFKVMHTPGHTRGGVCLICGDVIFSGDTLFYNEIGNTTAYGDDDSVMFATLRRLVALPGDYTVYPGHDRATTMDFERANNMYIRMALNAGC